MRITFVLGRANLRGGIRVVAIYADELRKRGHRVTVLSRRRPKPKLRAHLRELRRGRLPNLRPAAHASHLDGLGLDWRQIDADHQLTDADVPDADAIVATWWETANWIRPLSPSKGAKIFFCQGFEVHGSADAERVLETYRLPMHQICVSRWVRDQIRAATGMSDQTVVANAVDSDAFDTPVRTKQNPPRVGFMYSDLPIKGVDVAIRSLEIARERNDGLRAVSFGQSPPTDLLPLPPWIEFEASPTQRRIAEIYASCDAWLFSSRAEGFGLPLLEAMASRTPVIATPAGAAPELIENGGGIGVPADDPEAMAHAVRSITDMTETQWATLSDAAYRTAQSMNWSAATDRFEAALRSAAGAAHREPHSKGEAV